MTESEARTKWCPMVQLAIGEESIVYSNTLDGGDSTNCIGSDCMMWRVTGNHGDGQCGLAT